MRDFLSTWGLSYCIFVEAALLPAVALVLAGPASPEGNGASVAWFLGALAVGLAVIVAVTLAMGTSPGGLWYGVVKQHVHLAHIFSVPPGFNLGKRTGLMAISGTLVGLAYALGFWRSRKLIVLLKFCYPVGVIALLMILSGRQRAVWPLFFGLPWCWLVAAQGADESGEGEPPVSVARKVLALAAPLVALMAYPVAGSQLAYATLPVILGASVCLADVLRWLNVEPLPRRLAVAGVWGVAFLHLGLATNRSVRDFRASEPLGLPALRWFEYRLRKLRRTAGSPAGCVRIATRSSACLALTASTSGLKKTLPQRSTRAHG